MVSMRRVAVAACVCAATIGVASASGSESGVSAQPSTSSTRGGGLGTPQPQLRDKLKERAGSVVKDAHTSPSPWQLERSARLKGADPGRRIANTSVVVNASVATLWDVAVVRMSEWKDWSATFAANIHGPPAVGKEFSIESHFPDGLVKHITTPMEITDLETNKKVCWKMNYRWVVSSSLWAKHCIEFYQRQEGGILVRNYEDEGGALVPAVERFMGSAVEAGFNRWNEELRVRVERMGPLPR